MTTTQTLPTTVPVLTHAGFRIPKIGTIACHPLLGFCTVISRTQSALRLTVDEVDDAADVELRDGTIVSRADWMSRVSDASLTGACIEIAGLEARRDATPIEVESDAGRVTLEGDAFQGATAFIKELSASIEARVRGADEMIVSIDAAERCGWEFDEYATFTPAKPTTRGKAELARKAAASKAVVVAPPVEDEADDAMPSWMAEEMGECFNDDAVWTS